MYNLPIYCVAAAYLLIVVNSYGEYRANIPNGNRVPHPCKSNYLWDGVGHRVKDGGGNRNPFGIDFAAAGHKWTKELCEKDSDGDGKTNGYELGDPDCTWVKNNLNPDSDHLSHPGVCEPWTDPKCQNQLTWLEAACQVEEFKCDALNDPNLKNMTLLFPPTKVPAQETTYMCMEFEVDTSGDFHMVATQPILNNTNVMHHAVIFGCQGTEHELRSTPHQCGMVASNECRTIISIWTLGSGGECFHEKIGFRIGNAGYKRVALQFHWNNPSLRADYMDNSGMIIHYTSSKRENDAGVFTIGAEYLEIPGRTQLTLATSVCPGSCTKTFIKEKVYVVSALNHMHYIGRSQKVELFRNGTKVRDITYDQEFNYDSPVFHQFAQPIEVLPGDTLSTTCTYNSINRDKVTKYGDATSDEMCFGFLTYYPKENMQTDFCLGYKAIAHCSVKNNATFDGCNILSYTQLSDKLTTDMNLLNATCMSGCTEECNNLIRNNPCLKGDPKKYIIAFSWRWFPWGKEFIQLSSICDVDPNHASVKSSSMFTIAVLFSIIVCFKF